MTDSVTWRGGWSRVGCGSAVQPARDNHISDHRKGTPVRSFLYVWRRHARRGLVAFLPHRVCRLEPASHVSLCGASASWVGRDHG